MIPLKARQDRIDDSLRIVKGRSKRQPPLAKRAASKRYPLLGVFLRRRFCSEARVPHRQGRIIASARLCCLRKKREDQRAVNESCKDRLLLLALGDEACGQPSHVAFAEQKSEHVLLDDLDGLRVRGAEAVFIHNHREPFQPPFPALFGYVLVDPVAQRPGVGPAIETFRLALENLTIDSPRHSM